MDSSPDSRLTDPAALFLRDVEILEYDKPANIWRIVSAVGVAVVVRVVAGGVLQFVQDDAGGGNACSLQQTHQIDHKGAQQLF